MVFTNAGDGNPGRYVQKAFERVAPHLAKEEERTVTYDPDWDMYVGTYRNRWGGGGHPLVATGGRLWK